MRSISFEDLWGFDPAFMDITTRKLPKWDQDEEKYFVKIPVPGAERKDFKVQKKEGVLHISFDGNDYTYKFEYKYELPYNTQDSDIKAKLESGILSVSVKKPKGHQSEIKVE